MKKALLHFLCFCAISTIDAQDYTPIDFSNPVWYMQAVDIDPATHLPAYFDHYFCQFDGDTTITNQAYHKYYYKKYRNAQEMETGYLGAFREENRQVFFLHKDSLTESVLYDFNKMSIGDTLPAWKWLHNDYSVFVIKEVDTVTLQDGSLRTASYFGLPGFNTSNGVVIEGIGSSAGLLPVRYFTTDYIYDGGSVLTQFCKNQIPLLQENSLGQLPPNGDKCHAFVDAGEVNNSRLDVKIYPNPLQDQLIVELFGEYEVIRINLFSAAGKQVFKLNSNGTGGRIQIETGELSPGYYWLTMQHDDRMSHFSLVKQ